ncbi:MAG TPA: GNAT family N-acetyltransferase [Candidatus Dormibacteraeota bacterium]|nr:GNAT family N-acetyltransferase [Candidatus Dormibacteraeota bacterium]
MKSDPRGFQVGLSRGKIVCFAITILRGKTHFLAQFFALPGAQSQGIGRKVLTRAFEEPRPPASAVRCLVASLDLRAQSLYMKFGMQPHTIVYHMTGKPSLVRSPSKLKLVQVGQTGRPSKLSREIAARFDVKLRGTRRDIDQQFFLTASPRSRFFEAMNGERSVGYVVVRGNGAIGPGGVADATLSGDLLSAAMEKTRLLRMKKIFVWIPGLNAGAIQAALTGGLKMDFVTVWMAAKPLGNLETYIPSGGVLF